MSLEERRKLVDVELAMSGAKKDRLSIVKQCEVLDIRRSGFYYTATPTDEDDLRVMRVMDELHMEDPCMGTRMLSKELRAKGIMAGRARVRSLKRLMRIKAVYCVPRPPYGGIDRIKYKHPYLLRGLDIDRRNQVWSVDITYLPVRGGFMYMVAVIDVHTRYLLNWSISNSMEAAWVTAMITEAIAIHGRPEIINRAIDPIAKAASSPARNTPPCSARVAWPKASRSAWTVKGARSTTSSSSASGAPSSTTTSIWRHHLMGLLFIKAANASLTATTTDGCTRRLTTGHRQHATTWQPEISTEQRVMSLPWTPHFNTNNHTYI